MNEFRWTYLKNRETSRIEKLAGFLSTRITVHWSLCSTRWNPKWNQPFERFPFNLPASIARPYLAGLKAKGSFNAVPVIFKERVLGSLITGNEHDVRMSTVTISEFIIR